MSRQRREENLARITRELSNYARENGLPAADTASQEVQSLADHLYLAHSTADCNFALICHSNLLLSPRQLSARDGAPLPPDAVEVILGTANEVFVYVAPFRFPATNCGILFCHTLENHERANGIATAFDSGGLVRNFVRPNPAETPSDFLRRHEFPIPEHRHYLQASLHILFGCPQDYLRSVDPRWPGPIGLTGGDCRRWTHEVRIPNQIHLRGGHLQAVLVSAGRVADPDIEQMLNWCERSDVDYIPVRATTEDDFEALRRECVDYVVRNLL